MPEAPSQSEHEHEKPSPLPPVRASLPQARDLSTAELHELGVALGARPFQARQVVHWVYRKGLRDFAAATDLPSGLRRDLAARLSLAAARTVDETRAADGTRKLLLGLADGETVEMVLIPEGLRTTLCLSAQVGCPVGCIFCASGMLGVRRNLGQAEILEQFLIAHEQLEAAGRTLTNLVVMGLGEPMLNLKALMPALERISDPEGFAFSPRRITVSTSGFPDRMRQLASCGKPYNLAVSLHAADPRLRKELVPTAAEDPESLVSGAMDYHRATGREPTFEVVLLAGRNDRERDAADLVRLLRGHPCTVNLIPWNPVPELTGDLRTPPDKAVTSFRRLLVQGGLNVTIRRRRGADKDAACGQLRLRRL